MNSTEKTTDEKYNPSEIEKKWQEIWEEEKIYSPDLDSAKRPFYNLMMFPYPSAEGMHVGNMYAFTGADVYGRFQRMQGKDVFEPIGLDGFGIHSENYAIKVGNHPVEQAKISEKNFYRQLRSIGNGFDWTRAVETYKPEYYKWTQWLFIQLFKAGLAYRKKAPVNFCPSCKTVLADEQVIQKLETQNSKLKTPTQNSKVEESVGVCERCETPVEKRDLEQWFFRITKYADRLLDGLNKIDWVEKVKIAQRQWIGRSEGALIRFKIKDLGLKDKEIEVFTTRADTLYGATFLVLAPEHSVSQSVKDKEVQEYIKKAKSKSDSERIENKEKTGVFTGLYAVNPVNNEKIAVWIADYAVMGYGTGALFGDAHDERDTEFANKYGIPLKPTLITGDKKRDKRIMDLEECFTGYGILVNSGEFSGLKSEDAKKKITEWLRKKSSGGPKTTYHLRDWLISRQRYWGPPIPLVFCENCARKGESGIKNQESRKEDDHDSLFMIHNSMKGWFSVPEDQLPVKLPFIEDYKPLGTGKAPLASHPEFYKTKCPNCGMDAKRETDVSDTFLDSSWYFLRYLATDRENMPFPSKSFSEHSENSAGQNVRKSDASDNRKLRYAESSEFSGIEKRLRWLPVNMYIGGAEHSVLHLLYSRFITMALKDLGFISFEEPFAKFRAHGLIVKDGAKMSKSKGNVVVPDQYIKKFGADTVRAYLMFSGPFSQGADFRDTGIEGMFRFVKRVWNLVSSIKHPHFAKASRGKQALSIKGKDTSSVLDSLMHKTIKNVTEDVENLNYNTAIAHLMKYYNELFSFYTKYKILNTKYCKTLVLLFAPFAPHVSEELFQLLKVSKGKKVSKVSNVEGSIHTQPWPVYDSKYLVKDELIVIIQINGKLRGNLVVDLETSKNKAKIEELARKDKRVQAHLEGKSIKKVIHVEGKVVNFVAI